MDKKKNIKQITDLEWLHEKRDWAQATLHLTSRKEQRLSAEIDDRKAKLVLLKAALKEWTDKAAELEERIKELEAKASANKDADARLKSFHA